ncbi:MAG: HNH endonuclease, partial [Candidatus Dormibacteraeota bacterium]|nr:HNH endonuclease [Candidatus Dormibacteraeota bacterium]
QVDAEKALAEANHAHQRRSLHVSEPSHGLVRVDGWLDEEGGAILNRALDRFLPPPARDDDRTPGQRRADALIELCSRPGTRSTDGAGARPHLVVRASLDTLAGTPGAPGGQLEGAGSVHGETVRRVACDAALTRITGQGELEAEVSRATRTIPPATRRALAARDHGCVAEGCGRPPDWTDAHHIKHWVHGGETTMANLVLLCRRHHRMVHEEGWTMRQSTPGRWMLARPVAAHARSA